MHRAIKNGRGVNESSTAILNHHPVAVTTTLEVTVIVTASATAQPKAQRPNDPNNSSKAQQQHNQQLKSPTTQSTAQQPNNTTNCSTAQQPYLNKRIVPPHKLLSYNEQHLQLPIEGNCKYDTHKNPTKLHEKL